MSRGGTCLQATLVGLVDSKQQHEQVLCLFVRGTASLLATRVHGAHPGMT